MRMLRDLRRYPSAIAGLVIVAMFVLLAIFAVITVPYDEAIQLWSAGSVDLRADNPKNAKPIWYDWFTSDSLPRTIVLACDDEDAVKTEESIGDGMKRVEITFPFDYYYDRVPKEMAFFSSVTFDSGGPVAAIYFKRPDGAIVTITEGLVLRREHRYYISQDTSLREALGGVAPRVALFSVDPYAPTDQLKTLQGRYEMRVVIDGVGESEVRARVVIYGEVHGIAGTDNIRRDLGVAMLWGAVVALMFGILAAIGAQVSTFVLAAIGTWFGGKVDAIFQRITEVNLILPALPILIMVGYFYSRSIWLMLGLVIALNVFSGAMKTYRAMFLQAKEAPYFEAAQAYGTGNMRIVFRYLLPRLAPTLLPQFVMVIPSFVFLEATLAVLGLGDPKLPTWGKMLNDAFSAGALYRDHFYWVLQPSVLLMLIGFGFAMLGYSLDRIFNPRLRTI